MARVNRETLANHEAHVNRAARANLTALSIGTNLGNRLVNLREAVRRLNLVHGVRVTSKSDVFETAPWGVLDQPAFLNACLLIECELEPQALLSEIKKIEREMGRVKNIRWGARKIDIDILLIDDLVYESREQDLQDLTVPHVNLHNRDFVLVPLEQILPDWRHPRLGLTVREMTERLRAESTSESADTRSWPLLITYL